MVDLIKRMSSVEEQSTAANDKDLIQDEDEGKLTNEEEDSEHGGVSFSVFIDYIKEAKGKFAVIIVLTLQFSWLFGIVRQHETITEWAALPDE
jgi:hypothetical protein